MFPKALKTLQILSSADSSGPTLVPYKLVAFPFPIHIKLIQIEIKLSKNNFHNHTMQGI